MADVTVAVPVWMKNVESEMRGGTKGLTLSMPLPLPSLSSLVVLVDCSSFDVMGFGREMLIGLEAEKGESFFRVGS
ncbi:uncharacterized protein G2W53_033469 [Senna tora]|uniref:Uncharacterized protein n=1 Tax=Senna tora TaxID=362788 RepID=A0A834W8G4_9FABA|nr:uncharacterized protein G2W53_033469 [Senna tora]